MLEQNGNSSYDLFTFPDTQSNGWNPADYDPIIVLTGTSEAESFFNAPNYTGTVPDAVINEAFVGISASGLTSYSATGPQYALVNPNDFVIPEPTTPALVGLGAACMACRRFRRGRRSPSSAPVPRRL